MQSWWSPSHSPQGEADIATLVRRFVEASRRAEIIALVNSAHSDREVAEVTVGELSEAFEAEVAFVVVTRPGYGRRETIGQTGMTLEQAAAVSTDSLCRAALGSARPDVHSGSDLLGMGARHLALSPWTTENGRQVVIGVARLYDEPFDPAEIALLEAVTASVGHGLERAWLGAERDRHAARQGALARAARSVSATLDGHQVRRTLSSEIAEALEADVVIVYAVGGGENMEIVAGAGIPAAALGSACPADGGLCAEVARIGEPRICQPFEDRTPVELAGVPQLRSGAAVPIRPHGAVDAVVLVGYHGDRWLDHGDVELLTAFAELGGIACRNAADHAAAQQAAALDSLTGCLNHGAFQDRLREEIARAKRGGAPVTLVLMDLNDFKAVNDSFGHLAGDALLRGVADALRESVRPYDQVARYGGDEFALLLPATDDETARRVIDRALAAVAGVQLAVRTAVSACAGLAHWRPDEDANTLIARADRSLLDSKRARRLAEGGEVSRGAPAPGGLAEQRERHRLRRLVTAGSLGTRLGRLLDQRAIAETAIVELGSALGYGRCALVRHEEGDALRIVAIGDGGLRDPTASSGPDAAERELPRAMIDAIRRCLRERRTVLVAEVQVEAGLDVGAEPRGRGAPAVCSKLAVPIYVGVELWGAIGVRSAQGSLFDDDDAQLVQSVADHLGTALRTAELYEKLDRTHLGTAEALAAALEAKDSYTANHARSIADQAVAVGRELGLDAVALRDLRYGAIFHDIGKIAIPDAILNKPGPLSDSEREVVRRHPEVGEQILAPVPFLSSVREIVRHDHERWDGAGYPDGLQGERIPLGARIVLVVDAYHAMRSDRPYRRAMAMSSARSELLSNSGTQFDTRVVEALLAVLERSPEGEPG